MKRRLLFYLIYFVTLGLFAELIARAYYYQKPALSKSAAYQLLKDVKHSIFPEKRKWDAKSQYFVRPNISKKVNDSIAMETAEAYRLVYWPWVSFASINSNGKYVSTNDQARNSSPSVSTGEGADTLVFWFLGGSTMFGIGVTDAETIPAAFVRQWQQRNRTPIKVVNYGTPLYFSYQELMLFADNLFRGKVPGAVIMLDGLNDCSAPYPAYLRNPYNTPRLQRILNPDLYKKTTFFRYSDWPDSPNRQRVSEIILEYYLENIENVKRLADEYKIQLYCFWQPVPYYHYKNRATDPFCVKHDESQFGFIYPQVEQKASQLDYLYYLGDAVNDVRYPFLDSVHYTPKMCEAVAKRMVDSISVSPQLRSFGITR